jgi:hypothetical protein
MNEGAHNPPLTCCGGTYFDMNPWTLKILKNMWFYSCQQIMLKLVILREFWYPGSLSRLLICPHRRKLKVSSNFQSRNDGCSWNSVNSEVVHYSRYSLNDTSKWVVMGKGRETCLVRENWTLKHSFWFFPFQSWEHSKYQRIVDKTLVISK